MNVLDITNHRLDYLLGQDDLYFDSNMQNVKRIVFYDAEISKGDAFFCVPNTHNHSKEQEYVANAINRGAKVIIGELNEDYNKKYTDISFVNVQNARKLKAFIAAKVYPNVPRNIVAVTGTNGKTSVAEFVRQIWTKLGLYSASIGTMGVFSNCFKPLQNVLTTPDPIKLHSMLSMMKKCNIEHVALEASSHGITQHRLDYIDFKACGFTNLTQDHLDYHGSITDYFNAKKRLFSELLAQDKTAVINLDSTYSEPLCDVCKARGTKIIGYGYNAKSDIRLLSAQITDSGYEITLQIFGKVYSCEVNIVGEFQLYNLMCAIGLVISCGVDPDSIINVIAKLRGITGRIELMGRKHNGALVFVDYAHTPGALKEVLSSVRKHIQGKLKVVFGCGGDRDKSKRAIMGSIASQYSDVQYITDDNPRTEDPQLIRQSILTKCANGIEVPGRYEAIKQCIESLECNDACVVAGKGHEEQQIINDQVIEFSDRKVVCGLL